MNDAVTALGGIRVLDATRALTGPLATMIFGDLGAEVIKVELPEVGDETRYWGPPFTGNAGATFLGFNRNKRSVTIDLHAEEGQRRFLDLAAECDVVVENFRPGTMTRFGLDYEAVRRVRPDIIYCSISGYGQEGPLAKRPAMDLMVQAVSGLMSLTGAPEGPSYKAAAPVCDVMAGLSASVSLLAALRLRDRTGEGRFIDISMLDSMMVLMGQTLTASSMSGQTPTRQGNGHPLMAPYQSFKTASREIVLSVTNMKTWLGFTSVSEFAHLRADPDFSSPGKRNENRERLCASIQEILLTQAAAHWIDALDAAGVPAEPVNALDEILEHSQFESRASLMTIEYPPGSGNRIRTPGMPWADVVTREHHLCPPDLGEGNADILGSKSGGDLPEAVV